MQPFVVLQGLWLGRRASGSAAATTTVSLRVQKQSEGADGTLRSQTGFNGRKINFLVDARKEEEAERTHSYLKLLTPKRAY